MNQQRFILTREQLELCIEALRYKAHMEAGQTQQPDLRTADEYEEWNVADELEARLK